MFQKIKDMDTYMVTYTITFGDRGENHVGMSQIGSIRETGIQHSDILYANEQFEKKGCCCEVVDLVGEGEVGDITPTPTPAYVLIVRNAVETVLGEGGHDALFREQEQIPYDTKYFDVRRGQVLNKRARYNVCFDEVGHPADFEKKRGTVVPYSDVPYLSTLRNQLPNFWGEVADRLVGEGNKYYDIKKCGIGFHGDAERRVVIAARIGQSMPMHWQWYINHKPIGKRIRRTINGGDMYCMSEKATGFDWKKSVFSTVRHAAGCRKYLGE